MFSFLKRKKEESFDKVRMPIKHEELMAYLGLPEDELIMQSPVLEVFLDDQDLVSPLYAGKTKTFFFIARGEKMYKHVKEKGFAPHNGHAAYMLHYFNKQDLDKKIQYLLKNDHSMPKV
ncbi:hypothetical protein ACFYKX_25430 [Cytobacillus sp. FJAT-54145]|uniref:Uncharacterized protein n=1 Tax=Cytobacillus spartinae TaxID=3299023 RepID=A0ABW6KI43_9BACI